MPAPVALITGPTSGIGTRCYPRNGDDRMVVARDVDRLTQVADELQGPPEVISVAGCNPTNRRP
jgi:short-subunit dehydrogenase